MRTSLLTVFLFVIAVAAFGQRRVKTVLNKKTYKEN